MTGRTRAMILMLAIALNAAVQAREPAGAREFKKQIQPLLENYCYDCHADGANKGGVSFDEFKTGSDILDNHDLWLRVLKNLRAGLMPPARKQQPSATEKDRIADWIKYTAFQIDPRNPDPGRVTIRRLNRSEYRNTVYDLIGVDFDSETAFPPDDTGYGFDNIGDVLTLPPMLLEKYLLAANQIVKEAVPTTSRVMRTRTIGGNQFTSNSESPPRQRGSLALSYYSTASVTNTFKAQFPGHYRLLADLMINEKYVDNVFDYNKCRVIFRADGNELHREDYSWEGGKPFHYEFDVDWKSGNHELVFELQPLTPGVEQTRSLAMQITSVTVQGPTEEQYWVEPKNYSKFFNQPVPDETEARRTYARQILIGFACHAFRRPVDEETLGRLVDLAESVYSQEGKTFESGVAQAMVAVLVSPRFLFHEERAEPPRRGQRYARIDEFSLASRLSYLLWSSMPDDDLLYLAGQGLLRSNLTAQVSKMLKDYRSANFVRNFTGQWLRARDIEGVPLEARFILAREEKFDPEMAATRKRFNELNNKSDEQLTTEEKEELRKIRASFRRRSERPLRAEMSVNVRRAMRLETEKVFDYVLRQDRSLLELLDSDYTFLNEPLAEHYGITNVSGTDMRLVKLPPDSPRGGILTEGTVLGVTSNPTRTSPVKRGVFILDNILGTPPPPPPPDIPPLEDAAKDIKGRAPSLRETLAAHREDALCSSCHNRMDPLGLALENFNAMGMWRDNEYGEPIDATGKLMTGETFNDVRELKQILVKNHAKDFYRTVTEKLLIYALGRGLEYYDVETVDQIVARLEAAGGKPSALIAGVIESAPFQKTRLIAESEKKIPVKTGEQRADSGIKP